MPGVRRVWRIGNERCHESVAGRRYTVTYGVETDTPIDRTLVASLATGLPGNGSYWQEARGGSDPEALYSGREWQNDEKNRRLWYCNVEFSTAPAGGGGMPAAQQGELGWPNPNGSGNVGSAHGLPRSGERFRPGAAKEGHPGTGDHAPTESTHPDPVFRPAHISYGTLRVQRVMEQADRYVPDGNGSYNQAGFTEYVENSAHDEFVNKPGRDIYCDVVTVRRAERSYDRSTMRANKGCLNRDSWNNDPKLTWLIDDITADLGYEGIYGFYWVTYRLIYNPETWLIPLRDQGFRYLVSQNKPAVDIFDANGAPTATARPLDGAGGLLGANLAPIYRYYWPSGMVCNFDMLYLL